MTAQITNYKIVYGFWVKPKLMKQSTLEENVAQAIGEGWVPLGAAFTIQLQEANPLLGQVVVKYGVIK